RNVMRIPAFHEAVAAFLNPALEVGGGDLVGPAQHRVVGGQQLHRRLVVHHLLRTSAQAVGVRPEVVVVFAGLVLNDEGAAVFYIIEQAPVVGGQLGARGVGADAQHDRVIVRQIGGGEILGGEEVDVDAQILQRLRDIVAGAGDVTH